MVWCGGWWSLASDHVCVTQLLGCAYHAKQATLLMQHVTPAACELAEIITVDELPSGNSPSMKLSRGELVLVDI